SGVDGRRVAGGAGADDDDVVHVLAVSRVGGGAHEHRPLCLSWVTTATCGGLRATDPRRSLFPTRRPTRGQGRTTGPARTAGFPRVHSRRTAYAVRSPPAVTTTTAAGSPSTS